MSDKQKFEGFKQKLVDDNEARYGQEIRQKYGDKAMDESNANLLGKSRVDFDRTEELSNKVNELLKKALQEGSPNSPLARELCLAHKAWLMHYWKTYSLEAHRALGQMYVDDERFTKYYEDVAPGGADFLRDALANWDGE